MRRHSGGGALLALACAGLLGSACTAFVGASAGGTIDPVTRPVSGGGEARFRMGLGMGRFARVGDNGQGAFLLGLGASSGFRVTNAVTHLDFLTPEATIYYSSGSRAALWINLGVPVHFIPTSPQTAALGGAAEAGLAWSLRSSELPPTQGQSNLLARVLENVRVPTVTALTVALRGDFVYQFDPGRPDLHLSLLLGVVHGW